MTLLPFSALLAQLTSLPSVPLAERKQREAALQSKRATVEAWLAREASTLQKYRLVRTHFPSTFFPPPQRSAAKRGPIAGGFLLVKRDPFILFGF